MKTLIYGVVCLSLVFLTSGQVSFAAAHKQAGPAKPLPESTSGKNEPVHIEEANLILSQPPSTKADARIWKRYYPYHQSISPRSGFFLDMRRFSENRTPTFFIGFNYLLPKYYSPQWELGVDIATNAKGYLNVLRRWTINEREGLRPFLKAGIMHRVEGRDKFATFLNKDNYMLKLGGGLEDLMEKPVSFRFDVEAAIGLEDLLVLGALGFSWGL